MTLNPIQIKRATKYYPTAEALNEEGVRLFGEAWLGANEEMISILSSWGFEPRSQRDLQQLSMLIALRLGKQFRRF